MNVQDKILSFPQIDVNPSLRLIVLPNSKSPLFRIVKMYDQTSESFVGCIF